MGSRGGAEKIQCKCGKHSKLRRGRAVDPSHKGCQIYRISCIGVSRVEAPNCCNGNCDIATRDIPTSPEPSINWDMCQEIQRSQGSEYRGFQGQSILASWNRDPRYPDEPRTIHQLGCVSGDLKKSGFRVSEVPRTKYSGSLKSQYAISRRSKDSVGHN
jgi:hypothetical protein